jgi:hypothetical protein
VRGLLDRFTKPGGNGDDGVELLDDTTEPYASEPVRPWMLLGSRALLWGAVAVGAFGGVVGCLAKTRTPPAPVVETDPDPALVPPQVTETAEHIVERWLLATTEQAEEMEELFVEPPDLPTFLAGRYVVDVRTVSSGIAADGYWSVTVAADMEQAVETEPTGDSGESGSTGGTEETEGTGTGGDGEEPSGDEQDEGDEEGSTSGPFTWYVEIGIVGDPLSGLRAHRTPALMPPPALVEDGRASTSQPWERADQEDDLVQTIDGFLDALLAGNGDPDRYFVEELEIEPIEPAPLDDVLVEEISVQELDDGVTRAQVKVTGFPRGGGEQPLAYELDVRWTGQEYEILRHWGSATLVG